MVGKGAVSEGPCMVLALELLDAVDHMHSADVIHMDIKPVRSLGKGWGAPSLPVLLTGCFACHMCSPAVPLPS